MFEGQTKSFITCFMLSVFVDFRHQIDLRTTATSKWQHVYVYHTTVTILHRINSVFARNIYPARQPCYVFVGMSVGVVDLSVCAKTEKNC